MDWDEDDEEEGVKRSRSPPRHTRRTTQTKQTTPLTDSQSQSRGNFNQIRRAPYIDVTRTLSIPQTKPRS